MTFADRKSTAEGWVETVRHWLSPGEGSHAAGAGSPAPAPHTHVLVPERLRSAGLDPHYESVAEPELVAGLKAVCSTCPHTEACTHDFKAENANERVAEYCPNTPAIDELMVERATGKII